MSNYALLAFSMAAFLVGSITKKIYSGKTSGNLRLLYVFNLVCSLLPCLILLAWGGIGTVSLFTILLACVFGLVIVAQTIFTLKALECGPMSYTNVICSFSTIITALSGAMFFGEALTVTHIIGIALMVVSFLLAVEKQSGQKATSLRWLLYCVIAFLCTGGIGLMQKVHQSSVFKEELNAFLVIAFGVSALATLPLLLAAPKPATKTDSKGTVVLIICLVLSGISIALNNKWNLYLSGAMDSAVFFPIVNGGGMALNALAAVIFFREKPTIRQWLGIALGIASVLFLCNPFA